MIPNEVPEPEPEANAPPATPTPTAVLSRQWLERWLSLVAAMLLLGSQLLFQSTFSRLGGADIGQLCVVASVLAIVVAVGLVVVQGQLLVVSVFAVALIFLVVQCYIYAAVLGAGVQLNILASYLTMVAFPVFAVRGLPINRVCQVFFLASAIYCAIYVVRYDSFVDAYQAAAAAAWRVKHGGAVAVETGVRVLAEDSTRAPRVFIAGTFATFALFYSLVRMRTRGQWRWLPAAALATTAIVMSVSRVYVATVALVTMLYLIRLVFREQRWVYAGVFLLLATVIVAGVPFAGWNPFAVADVDQSAAVRARAYEIICRLIEAHPLFGVGIAPSAAAQGEMIGLPSVFASDLGVLGVWFAFGLPGLVLYCAEVVLVMVGSSRPPDLTAENHMTVVLSGLVIGLGAWLSPDMWGGASGLIAAITVGLFLRREGVGYGMSPLWFVANLKLFGGRGLRR